MDRAADIDRIYRYHDGTKHHFDRFAQSLGYLDWASQPRPFRSFEGAPAFGLYPAAGAITPGGEPAHVSYDQLFEPPGRRQPLPVTAATLGYFLRYSLGLSAWKAIRGARWSLRVNPSSGNLHPTEAYLATGPIADFGDTPGVWHYAPDRHALERRCSYDRDAWSRGGAGDGFFIALTSIHWRESWKYGERAFRYCQHDLGHAIAALGLAAALCGWRLSILRGWPHRDVAALTGIDRADDYVDAEREEPGCVMLVVPADTPTTPAVTVSAEPAFLDAVRRGRWFGHASQLSEEHVLWTFIDEAARATEDRGEAAAEGLSPPPTLAPAPPAARVERGLDARTIVLQRRSAIAFDGQSSIDRARFLRMIGRTLPTAAAPWNALWWMPRIHLAVFVHRVDDLEPGLYLLARAEAAVPRLQAAFRNAFQWERVEEDLPLWLLTAGDQRALARRLSCDQDIAADGFFSLGMLADFDAGLAQHGPSFYRHLFWESGVVGQVLYLEAEAAGTRATGIGCFYDDPVHHVLGIASHVFQSLYHFTIGVPVHDERLTTEPGYAWETRPG